MKAQMVPFQGCSCFNETLGFFCYKNLVIQILQAGLEFQPMPLPAKMTLGAGGVSCVVSWDAPSSSPGPELPPGTANGPRG